MKVSLTIDVELFLKETVMKSFKVTVSNYK